MGNGKWVTRSLVSFPFYFFFFLWNDRVSVPKWQFVRVVKCEVHDVTICVLAVYVWCRTHMLITPVLNVYTSSYKTQFHFWCDIRIYWSSYHRSACFSYSVLHIPDSLQFYLQSTFDRCHHNSLSYNHDYLSNRQMMCNEIKK